MVTFSSDQHKLVHFLQDHAFYHSHNANNNHRWTLKGEKKADYSGILGLKAEFPVSLLPPLYPRHKGYKYSTEASNLELLTGTESL